MPEPHPHLNAPSGYLFVVTYGRSGSTVVQNLLNHLEGVCIRGENNNALAHLARAWHAVAQGEVPRRLRKSDRVTGPGDPWYGIEAVAPQALGRGLADGFVREVLRPPPGTRIAGFKEIRFHSDARFFAHHLDFMRRFFPGARFVFNTRDHAAVARSGWWAKMDPARVGAKLRAAEALFDAYAAHHPGISLQLRYEEYDGRPEGLRPLFEIADAPFDAALAARILAQRLDHLQPAKE